ALAPVAVNAPFSQQFHAVGGGSATGYTFAVTAGSLPLGVSLSPAGLLAGTPSQPGVFPFTVTATDSGGFAGGADYELDVASLPFGTAGSPFRQALDLPPDTAVDRLGGGRLPAGLAFATQPDQPGVTLLAGTPTEAGFFAFVTHAQVTDPDPGTAAAVFFVNVAPAIRVSPATLADGTLGNPYAQPLSAAGGDGGGSFTFAVSAGALPPGLALTPDGQVGGTPTAAGTFAVTGAGGATGSTAYSLVVHPALALGSNVPAALLQGSPADPVTATATGGT